MAEFKSKSYNIESFYEGNPSSLEPSYGGAYGTYTGYRQAGSVLSLTTKPDTANQIRELTQKLNTGAKAVEMTLISPAIFEEIPKQHLEELRRLAKQTGAKLTIHGPVRDVTGFNSNSGMFDETMRKGIERQLVSNVKSAAKIAPGSLITFHSSEGLPEMVQRVKVKKGKKEVVESIAVVDTQTGQFRGMLKQEEKYFPRGKEFTGERIKFDPEEEIKDRNKQIWAGQLRDVTVTAARGDDFLQNGLKTLPGGTELYGKWKKGEFTPEEFKGKYTDETQVVKESLKHVEQGEIMLDAAFTEMSDLFDIAYRTAREKKDEKSSKRLNDFGKRVADYRRKREQDQINPQLVSDIVEDGVKVLSDPGLAPKRLKRMQEFAMEKTAQTFGDVAYESYKKLKDKTPIISIENPPAGHAFSRAEDLKKIVDKSRDVFVERAKKAGYSEGDARRISEKIIGATWDIGHINMIRRFGYDEKDVVKETKKIAKDVRHVHLSDNFGFEHTELPMGMGNVPTKEHLELLKGKGFKGEQVVEVAAWFKHFADQGSPLNPSLEAFGAPVYGVGSPYWNQVGYGFGHYITSSYGEISPDVHHNIYGAGFSTLPQDLGGQIPGERSRLSGTQNA